jgi:hypothetical protein
MNKTLLFVFILPLLVCQACYKPSPVDVALDKVAVTKLTILALLPPDTTFKNERRRNIQSSREMLNYRNKTKAEKDSAAKRLDSLEHKLDTVKIIVEIADTLATVRPGYLKSKLSNTAPNPHSLYRGLEKWESDINITNNQKLLNTSGLPTETSYRFLVKRVLDIPSQRWFNAGNIKVSEIYFNEDRTKAFAYGEMFCGNLCGAGYDLFFEKKNGKWRLTRQIMGWVS